MRFCEKEQIKTEMVKAASFMRSLPPQELWQSIRPHIRVEEAQSFERKWLAIGLRLSDFFSDTNHCPIDSFTNSEKKFVEVYTNYYAQLGLLIFQALPFIKDIFYEVERRLDEINRIPFKLSHSSVLIEIMKEDCYAAIQHNFLCEFYESPSEKEAQFLWRTCMNFLKGSITVDGKACSPTSLTLEQWKHLNGELNKIFSKLGWSRGRPPRFWNDLCTEVFKPHRSELPAFTAWVDAKEQKFHVEKWVKHLIQYGERKNYPGRGRAKKQAS